MANEIPKAATNTINEITSGIGAQANELTYNAVNNAETISQNVVSTVPTNKSKELVSGDIPGVNPNSSNPYKAKITGERPKNWDSTEGTYSNSNLNDFVVPYDNVLLQYDNYTYHFTLFGLSSSEYQLFWDNPDTEVNRHIIAESGVTGRFSIDSVQITTAGPASPGLTSNFSFNNCVMSISENNGMSLFNDLVVLANDLGYNKFMDLPLIMEMDFIGFHPVTGKPNRIPGLNRKWAVRINTIKARATDSGGTMIYDLQMTRARAGLVENKNWMLKEPYTCTSATFGDFVQQIQDKLNSMANKQYGYLQHKYSEFANGLYYEIHVPDELAGMSINYDMKQSKEVGTTANGSDGAKNFSWSADVPVSRAFDDVIDCCIPVQSSTDRRRQFINIIPVQKVVGYDPIRANLAYKNHFYIVKYNIGDVVSEEDLKHEKFNFEYFFENADKYAEPGNNEPKLNIKRYDYQFTGLNQEILNLELKFDQGFNIAVTRNPDTQRDIENREGTHAAEYIQLGDVTYNTNIASNVTDMWSKSQDLKDEQAKGRTLSQSELQFIRDTDAVTQMKVGQQDEQTNNIGYQSTGPKYIEDYRNEYDMTYAGTEGIGGKNGTVDAIPTEPENIKTTKSGSVNDNSTSYEMDRRLMRDNYYNRSFLSKLDMKVVGDPFWLGWSDISYMNYLKKAVAGEDIEVDTTDVHFANWINSEAYLLLNIKPVVSISERTGILDYDTPTIFSQTVYRVNKVVSEFGPNGSFTQQLSAGIVMRSLRRRDQLTDNDEGNASNG